MSVNIQNNQSRNFANLHHHYYILSKNNVTAAASGDVAAVEYICAVHLCTKALVFQSFCNVVQNSSTLYPSPAPSPLHSASQKQQSRLKLQKRFLITAS
jgi:hypothetical protein